MALPNRFLIFYCLYVHNTTPSPYPFGSVWPASFFFCIHSCRIEQYCQEYAGQRRWGYNFSIFDSLDPIVDTRSCFDLLRIPEDHVSRKPSDTYYLDDSTVCTYIYSVYEHNIYVAYIHPSISLSISIIRRAPCYHPRIVYHPLTLPQMYVWIDMKPSLD